MSTSLCCSYFKFALCYSFFPVFWTAQTPL